MEVHAATALAPVVVAAELECPPEADRATWVGSPTSATIAATTITGDSVCRSTNVDYRLDTDSARSFLAEYVALP